MMSSHLYSASYAEVLLCDATADWTIILIFNPALRSVGHGSGALEAIEEPKPTWIREHIGREALVVQRAVPHTQ